MNYRSKLEFEVEEEARALMAKNPELTLDQAKQKVRFYRRRAYKDTDVDDPDILRI